MTSLGIGPQQILHSRNPKPRAFRPHLLHQYIRLGQQRAKARPAGVRFQIEGDPELVANEQLREIGIGLARPRPAKAPGRIAAGRLDLTTSAPKSARDSPAPGPATTVASSTTWTPASGRVGISFPLTAGRAGAASGRSCRASPRPHSIPLSVLSVSPAPAARPSAGCSARGAAADARWKMDRCRARSPPDRPWRAPISIRHAQPQQQQIDQRRTTMLRPNSVSSAAKARSACSGPAAKVRRQNIWSSASVIVLPGQWRDIAGAVILEIHL